MRRQGGLSIAQLVFAITIVPTVLMFAAVAGIASWQRKQEIELDLQYRGRVLATALAEGAVFGVVTADGQALSDAIENIRRTDPDLASLAVLGPDGRVIASFGPTTAKSDDASFDQPIRLGALPPGALDLDLPGASESPKTSPARTLGTARIVLTRAPLLAAHRRALALSGVLTLMAAVLCGAIGWWLSTWLRRPMRAILDDLGRLRDGAYELPPSQTWAGEIGGLQGAVREVAGALKASTTDMERTVQARTAELDAAHQEAARAADERKALIVRTGQQLEEERKRIALEIHDELNASLVVMRMHAQHIVDECGGRGQAPTSLIEPSARNILDDVAHLYSKARDIVRHLRPETLDALGLAAALRELVRGFHSSSCLVSFEPVPALPRVADEQAIAVYRCVQEAISNALKHAGAKAITVAAAVTETGLSVSVVDDGVGFDVGAPSAGVGLIGMRERIDAVGGSLKVSAADGIGTEVVIQVPWGEATSPAR